MKYFIEFYINDKGGKLIHDMSINPNEISDKRLDLDCDIMPQAQPSKCDKCDETLSSKTALANHKQEKHPRKTPGPKSKEEEDKTPGKVGKISKPQTPGSALTMDRWMSGSTRSNLIGAALPTLRKKPRMKARENRLQGPVRHPQQ